MHIEPPLIRVHQLSSSSPLSRPQACRRCHKNKEKCDLTHSQSSCSNCYRLGIPCHTRQVHRMGRRPKIKKFSYGASSIVELGDNYMQRHDTERIRTRIVRNPVNEHCLESNTRGTDPRDLSKCLFRVSDAFCARPLESSLPLQEQILEILTKRESFLTANRPFMLGSSFVDQFQATVVLLFRHNPHVLSEAYGVLLELMRNPSTQQHENNPHIKMATRSLQCLQQLSCSISTILDAAVLILLGQILLAYNAFLPLASYTPIITRCILGSTGHWYEALRSQPEFDNITVAPVLIDTVDCLIRRKKPMIRLPEVSRCSVERFSGYCSSLLPYLHDIARLSHEIKTAILGKSDETISIYNDIEETIGSWTPPACATCLEGFSIDEISVMSSQAYAYRDAALLIIHRLRFPFGTKDGLARNIAERMLDRLALSLKRSSTDYRPLLLDFPLLVASLELPALGRSTFKIFEPFRYRDSRITLEFVEYVEQRRLQGYRGSWFELVGGDRLNDFVP